MTNLPLDEMTVEEKLRVMESIWQDLCRRPGDVPSPDWHRDELAKRKTALQRGEDSLVDWDEAKRIISKRTR